MTPEMLLTLGILAAAIVLFITEWVRLDVVALGVVIALMITDILTTGEAIAGFASTSVILIAALFVVGGAVFQTGLAALLGRQILYISGESETRLIVVIMIAVAVMSGFMSSTGVVAVMLPAILSLAASTEISPSRLLIPLSFGSLLGGASTLIGTPPNIIVSEALRDAGLAEFTFFDFMPLAILLTIAGVIFMVTVGKNMLPDRKLQKEEQEVVTPSELLQRYALPDSIYKLRVRKASDLIDRELGETRIGHEFDIDVLEISRPAQPRTVATIGEAQIVVQSKSNIPVHPRPETTLQRDDILLVKGTGADVGRLAATHNLMIMPRSTLEPEDLINQQVGVAEAVLPPRSTLVGKTLTELRFGSTYRLTVLGITRADPAERERKVEVKNTRLAIGDTLLVQGEWRDIMALNKRRNDFVLLDAEGVALHLFNREKAPVAAGILVFMLVLMIFGGSIGIGTTLASLIAALLVVLTGCLSMDEAYDSIDWKSIVLIAGMLPMSTALEKVGLVDMIAGGFTATLGDLGPIGVLAGLFLLTSVLTQVLSNTATTVLLAPIALAIATTLDVSPHALLMAVAVSASMAFASPVASPVNTLVMGAGNYRFGDYVKIGVPLILIMLVVSVIALPVLFPF